MMILTARCDGQKCIGNSLLFYYLFRSVLYAFYITIDEFLELEEVELVDVGKIMYKVIFYYRNEACV